MKKFFSIALAAVLSFALVACATGNDNSSTDTSNGAGTEDSVDNGSEETELETIRVGVSFYPMADILELVEEDLNEVGYTVDIQEFSEYQTPNNLVLNQELDANMIQHQYFMEQFNEANDGNLEVVLPIYHATFALYSQEYTSLDEIPEGATITLPDDSTNLSRAIYLLDQAGLIEIADGKTTGLTLDDIVENPLNLDLTDHVPLTTLAQRYVETGMVVMYPTYARSLELEGDEQRLYVEQQDEVTEGYAISMVASADSDSAKVQALVDAVNTEKVSQFLIDEYAWASSPAF